MVKYIICFLYIFCSSFFQSAGNSSIVLVTGDSVNTNIQVQDSNTQLKNAAEELQNYFARVTGKHIPIVYNIYGKEKYTIKIGTALQGFQIDTLDEDGYIIEFRSNKIYITGRTDWGTEFGVYSFIEKFLGVKWLMPGDLWTEIPYTKEVKIQLPLSVRENPSFLSRKLSPIDIEENSDIGRWGRLNKLKSRLEYGHNAYKIFKSSQLKAAGNTNFFPIVGNKKYVPKTNSDQGWQPVFSAKGSDIWAVHNIKEFFKNNPKKKSFSLGINDSQNFDPNDKGPGKNYLNFDNCSDSYYSWVNRTVRILNKEIGKKRFGLLAYLNVASPPNFEIEPNVVPFLTFERLKWGELSSMQDDITNTLNWKKKAKELGWYDYVYGLNYLAPRTNFSQINFYLKKAKALGVNHYVAELYPNWLEGPKAWLISQLLWNTNQDGDHLLNDWYKAAVGETSALYLKQFYQIWETFWTIEIINSTWWTAKSTFLPFSDYSYVYSIPYEYISRSDQLMESVLRNAKTEMQKKRAEDLMTMWKFSRTHIIYIRQNPQSNTFEDSKYFREAKVTDKELSSLLISARENPLLASSANYIQRYQRPLTKHNGIVKINSANLIDNPDFQSKRNWKIWVHSKSNGEISINNNLYISNLSAGSIYQTIPVDFSKQEDFIFNIYFESSTRGDKEVITILIKPLDQAKLPLKNSKISKISLPLKKVLGNVISNKFSISTSNKIHFLELQISFINFENKEMTINKVELFKIDKT